jgi:type IV pilus assembly protein PilX
MYRKPIQSSRQNGMALVMGLIILLVMTLISVTAMRSTIMQERMSGSFQNQQVAYHAAETAMEAAYRELFQGSMPALGQGGYYRFANPNRNPPDWASPDAPPSANGAEVYDGDVDGDWVRDPQYFVQHIPVQCKQGGSLDAAGPVDRSSLRIMARGFGANENNEVVLESHFCR